MSISLDTDIFSLRHKIKPWIEDQDLALDRMEEPDFVEISQRSFLESSNSYLKELKADLGNVQFVRKIESRFRALFISRDNLSTLLQSFNEVADEVEFIQRLLAIKTIHLETADIVDSIEDVWTGNLRTTPSRPTGNDKRSVHVQLQFSYFIDSSWGLVRELTLLAIQADVLETLYKMSNWTEKDSAGCVRGNWTKGRLIKALETIVRSSPDDDLHNCKTRRTFALKPPCCNEYPERHTALRPNWHKSSPFKASSMVHEIYEMHRIGRRMPSEPFLRLSTSHHLYSHDPISNSGRGSSKVNEGWRSCLLYAPSLYSTTASTSKEHNLCIYIITNHHGSIKMGGGTNSQLAHALVRIVFGGCMDTSIRGATSHLPDGPWPENDLPPFIPFNKELLELGIDCRDLVSSIIRCVRYLRPERLRLQSDPHNAEATQRSTPNARSLCRKWLRSLPAEISAETALADEKLLEAVISGMMIQL